MFGVGWVMVDQLALARARSGEPWHVPRCVQFDPRPSVVIVEKEAPMSVLSRLLARMYRLPPAITSKLEVQTDIPVPMSDGVVLYASRFFPAGGSQLPVVLIRTPYSPRGTKPDILGELIAKRGYQAVVQHCR